MQLPELIWWGAINLETSCLRIAAVFFLPRLSRISSATSYGVSLGD